MRHLFERTVASVEDVLENDERVPAPGSKRCESISALTVQLQHLLEGCSLGKFVLVFDDIDRQRELPGTLFPALARLGDIVRVNTHILILPKLLLILV